MRRRHRRAALALAGLTILAGCGGERQDENEPTGDFEVEVVDASFPSEQKLARSSALVITVRNPGDRTIPNVGVTVDGFDYSKDDDATLADSKRPTFAVDGVPVEIAGFPEAKTATPRGCDSAYVNTWACGPLKAGAERILRWKVTAVRAGDYEVSWKINAGLHGNAKAVASEGGPAPSGSFTGTISAEAPESRVADDGKTVVGGTR